MTGSAALVGAGACAATSAMPSTLNNVAADAATATGERRRYVLSDGSQLLLDARSRVNLTSRPPIARCACWTAQSPCPWRPTRAAPSWSRPPRARVRALGTRYMVRQQAQRTVVVVHEHEVEVETMSGAHGTVRAGTGARFDALRMDTPRAELMAEAAWEAGWIDVRGRPLAEVIAALRPYRSGSLRISMAAGGLAGVGTLPLTTPTPPCARCRRACPSISAATPPGTCRSTSRPEPSPSCNVLSSGTVSLYTRHSILPAFLPQQAPPGFPGSRDKRHGRPGHPRTFHGDRDRNRRPGAPARHRASSA